MAKRSASPSRRRLDRLLQGCETPLFVVSAQRRILFFNRGCEILTGWSSDEVVGKVCHFSSSTTGTVEALADALCPPPEVFQGHLQQSVAEMPHRDGRHLSRAIQFQPLRVGEEVSLVIGMIGGHPAPQTEQTAALSHPLHNRLAVLRARLQERYGESGLIGQNVALQRVQAQMATAAQCDVAVLLRGETGTGKEHVARLIHQLRTQGVTAFVPLECAHLPARELRRTLQRLFAQSETDIEFSDVPADPLFSVRPGTLYLKDVEQLPRDAQEIILTYYRQNPAPEAFLRLMASTTTDLSAAVENETLCPNLYYLLTPLQIELPPLRSRPDDVELLAQAFLEEGNRSAEKQIGGFTESVRKQFRSYRWPGNLDELKTVVQEAREVCSGTVIDVSHLPFRFRTGQDAQSLGPPLQPEIPPLKASLEKMEAELIRAALKRARYNKTLAAQWLGLSRPKLYRRMQFLHIADEPTDDAEETSPPAETPSDQ